MAKRVLPDQETLLKLLRYEPETGKLFWRPRTPDMFPEGEKSAKHNCNVWNSNNAGKPALFQAAVLVRKAAEITYKFHENHGRSQNGATKTIGMLEVIR
jgi:hypothetical protein